MIDTTNREQAREYLTDTAARMRAAELRGDFCTFPRSSVYLHCEHVLRWIDCAPAGARFQLAPMQDKRGESMGMHFDENIGPNVHLRNARAKRGLCPFSGRRLS
jgi:hypothetical protein